MVVLRADPWSPEYGMGLEATALEEALPVVDPLVESADWSHPIRPPARDPCPLAFVDGVRRVDLRLWAEDEGRSAPGLFGTYAVGPVTCDGAATFGQERVEHLLVLGGGVRASAPELRAGHATLRFAVASVEGADVLAPLVGLQNAMRAAESAMAAYLAATEGLTVLVDGPLAYLERTDSPMIGLIKRLVRSYLGPDHDALVPRLAPGERTPLFLLGTEEDRSQRLSWYLRLTAVRPPWHDRAGIIRCEIRSGVGLTEARTIADRVTSLLPAFSGRPSDPRAPQNLAPVGALEARLRHRMGNPALVRRALNGWLMAS